jgi:hypothetical protein
MRDTVIMIPVATTPFSPALTRFPEIMFFRPARRRHYYTCKPLFKKVLRPEATIKKRRLKPSAISRPLPGNEGAFLFLRFNGAGAMQGGSRLLALPLAGAKKRADESPDRPPDNT